MNEDELKYVEKYHIQTETPPIHNKDYADVFLIRHGFSEFNHEQVALEKDGNDEDGSKLRALKSNISLVDPNLHNIGIYECEKNAY